jgi:error-prone DNA polymerase
MDRDEEMAADYAGTGLSTGPHPIAFARAALDRQGITPAGALRDVPTGRRVRVAGVVIVRQRPGTAKGFVFITVEDETGFANAIVTPQRFLAHRRTIVGAHALVIEGVVQNQQGVISIKADRFTPMTGRAAAVDVSHDFH